MSPRRVQGHRRLQAQRREAHFREHLRVPDPACQYCRKTKQLEKLLKRLLEALEET